MSNTITAFFKGRVGVAEAVYQNDYGLVMNLDGLDLPAHFDCYFSTLEQDEAIPGIGADNQVVIPNDCLSRAGNVTLHIPLHTGQNDSEVEYIVYFKVIGRARPVDDGTPVQMSAIERALALLQNPIGNIEQIVNEALSFTGETFNEMREQISEYEQSMTSRADAFESGITSRQDTVESQFTNLTTNLKPNSADVLWTGKELSGTLTLSQSISNYDFIDIEFYKSNTSGADDSTITKRIPATAGIYWLRNFALDYDNKQVGFYEQKITLADRSITAEDSYNIDGSESAWTKQRAVYNLSFKRVLGIKMGKASNAELTDIRVGADNVTYASAGEAVRKQFNDLKSALNDLDNTLTLTNLVFNGYFLLDNNKLIYAQNNVRIVYAEIPNGISHAHVKKTAGGTCQVGFTASVPANGVAIIDEAGTYVKAMSASDVDVAVPSTAKYIVAYVWNSNLDTATADEMVASVVITTVYGAKDIEARADISQLQDDVESLQEDKANADGTNTDYISFSHIGYTKDDVNLHSGVMDNHGVITPNTSFTVTDPIYLDAGVEYTIEYQGYYEGTTEKNAPRMMCTFKADDTFSRAFADESALSVTLYSDEEYIIICGFTHETKLNVYKTIDGGIKYLMSAPSLRIDYRNVYNAPEETENLGDMCRKATFSFIFDDATDGDVNVKALFDSYGLRCGFALPISALTNSKIARYRNYQVAGYEILSHSTDGTGMADPSVPISTIEGKMKSSKQTLESNGLAINGFVTPSSAILAQYIPALKRWYQFGYGQISDQSGYQVNTFSGKIEGIATDRDISQLPRCSLEASTSTVQFIKGIINTAVNNNGYVCFYGHEYPSTTNNMTEANVKEILDYLIGLRNEGKINILPPSQAIHSFYKVRHSDYLALINA